MATVCWSIDVGLRDLGVFVANVGEYPHSPVQTRIQHVLLKTKSVATKEERPDLRKVPLRELWPLLDRVLVSIYEESGHKWPHTLIIEQQLGQANRNQMVQAYIQGYLKARGCSIQISVQARSKWSSDLVKSLIPDVPDSWPKRKREIVKLLNKVHAADVLNVPRNFPSNFKFDSHVADAYAQMMHELSRAKRIYVTIDHKQFSW